MPSNQSDPDFQKKLAIWTTLVGDSGWEVSFPKYDSDYPIFDLEATLAEMDRCDLVVVDLSFERPSCYFELGLAEALHKKMAVISKVGTPIHQTSHRRNVRTYASIDDFAILIRDILHEGSGPG